MKRRHTDSPLVEKLIIVRAEVLKLLRETVTADRHSKKCSMEARPNRWTDAAKNRDYALKTLKRRLAQIAEDL